VGKRGKKNNRPRPKEGGPGAAYKAAGARVSEMPPRLRGGWSAPLEGADRGNAVITRMKKKKKKKNIRWENFFSGKKWANERKKIDYPPGARER